MNNFDASHTQADATPARSSRMGAKAKAVLAGGLVLGVGAAVTLAAWTDNEFATGLFGAGEFGIVGSANGAAFAEHDVPGSPVEISFAVDADNMAPDDKVYGSFGVKLMDDSTYAADVDITTNAAALPDGLTVSHVFVADATCDATAFAGGSDLNGTEFELPSLATEVYLCFEVAADSNLDQGASGNVVWTFAATSTDAL